MIMGVIAALSLTSGIGKALNNTNSQLPGYAGSLHISAVIQPGLQLEAGYTRLGATQLGEDSAISSIGLVAKSSKHTTVGVSIITGASYSAAVWWDKDQPDNVYGVEGGGVRYDNDGTHFSRACHLCGAVVTTQYMLGKGFALRAEYYGLRHMTPTFQGVIVQVTYTIGAR